MSTDYIANRIDGFISKDPKRVVDMWSAKKADYIHRVALDRAGLFQAPNSQLILDAGCGVGRLYTNLIAWGYGSHHIHGFDVSAEAIKHCPQSSMCKWAQASTVDDACRAFNTYKYDFGVCFGPLCYTQGKYKLDCLALLPRLLAVCKHGVGYFMYTSVKNAAPGKVFTRFHPDEVQNEFPNTRVIIDDELIAEYVWCWV